jgi:MoaA/NifB/PqqE/SkfB family radical SAM enzyme
MFKKIRLKMIFLNNFLRSFRYYNSLFNGSLPVNTIRLEASSMCQLRCILCKNAKGNNQQDAVGWGYLKFKDFRKFIDNHPEIRNIELSNWGEIFLNPELKEIIRYAYTKNVTLIAENGTNLNTISDEMIKYLVKYKFKRLQVSIDGASNKTYKQYRKGGNFERVIANIQKINYYKKKYDSKFPELRWSFVIFGHNEHEIPKARQLAKKLNMEFLLKFNYNDSFSPVKNKVFVGKETGLNVSSKKELYQKYPERIKLLCHQMWTTPQINWDGKLLGCCVNVWGDYGNVFKSGLKNCLKNKKYIYAKKMLLGIYKPNKNIPCFSCRRFKELQIRTLFDKINNKRTYCFKSFLLSRKILKLFY